MRSRALLTLLFVNAACVAPHNDDDAAAADESALTSGQIDPTFRVAMNETYLGSSGANLLFLGVDATNGGWYVARRTAALALDASYGVGGKAFVLAAPATGPTLSEGPPRAWISAAVALPDGRVVVSGSREGRGDYVSYGAFIHESKLTLGVVAADGQSRTLDVVDGLPVHPASGCVRVQRHGSSLIRRLSDGSLAVGGVTKCEASGATVPRLYHFTPTATGGFSFDRMFWQGTRRSIIEHTDGPSVSDLVEGAPGKFLVADSGKAIAPAGNTRASLAQRGYEAAILANPHPEADRPLQPIPTIGAISNRDRSSIATRLANGSLVVAGYSDASRCVGLMHTSANPDTDLVFGGPARPVTCVNGAYLEDLVAIAPGPSGRLMVVTDHLILGPLSPGALLPHRRVTRIRSVDPMTGALDPNFGTAGILEIANPEQASLNSADPVGAFIAGQGLLYLQLWDGHVFTPTGGGQVRRIKL